jgi:hypothetical protein
MSTIENTVDALAGLTDRQKIIVYVGPGLPHDRYGDLLLETVRLFRTAERANVVVYTFDPTGLDTLEEYVFTKVLLGARMTPAIGQGPGMSDLARLAQARGRAVANQTTEFSASIAENTGGRALTRRRSPR